MDLTTPFTPRTAARHGLGRSTLERMLRDGSIRRVFRGVYLGSAVPDTPALRARALAVRVGDSGVVVGGRTAAWLYGVLPPGGDVPWEPAGSRGLPPPRPGDVVEVGGVRCTSPVRTAVDLARSVAEEQALPIVDAFLRNRLVSHPALLAAAEAVVTGPGLRRLRLTVALADGRAQDAAESVLRFGWHRSRLPTPLLGVPVLGSRVALVAVSQGFGAVIGTTPPQVQARWDAAGWSVLELDSRRVLRGAPEILAGHLEREYHRHLLRRCAA